MLVRLLGEGGELDLGQALVLHRHEVEPAAEARPVAGREEMLPAEVILPRASGGAASASSSPRTVTGEARKVEPRTGQGTIDALHRGCWLPNPDGIGQEASGSASVTNSSLFVLW